jgi:hypothetical protein
MDRFTKFTKVLVLLVATCNPVFGICRDSLVNVIDQPILLIRKEASLILISEAQTWLGITELTGNNDHPRITESMKLCGLSGDKGYPWCASSQAQIHSDANLIAPHSARVVDWFKQNIIWKREWGNKYIAIQPGMVGAIYYRKLKRYGHIVLIVGEDKNNYYTLEGNTNSLGSRDGQGFYRKIRSKGSIAVIADYCLSKLLFSKEYKMLLQRYSK